MTTHYGIIGCGMMGQEHLSNIALLEDAIATVIYEPDPEMAHAPCNSRRGRFWLRVLTAFWRAISSIVCSLPVRISVMWTSSRQLPPAFLCQFLWKSPYITDPADWRRVEAFKRDYSAPVWVAMEYRYMPPMQQFLSRAGSATGGSRCLRLSSIAIHFCRRSATGTGSTVIRVAPLLKNAVISLI